MRCYDPRSKEFVETNNPALIFGEYYRQIYGDEAFNVSTTWKQIADAADWCDEPVDMNIGDRLEFSSSKIEQARDAECLDAGCSIEPPDSSQDHKPWCANYRPFLQQPLDPDTGVPGQGVPGYALRCAKLEQALKKWADKDFSDTELILRTLDAVIANKCAYMIKERIDHVETLAKEIIDATKEFDKWADKAELEIAAPWRLYVVVRVVYTNSSSINTDVLEFDTEKEAEAFIKECGHYFTITRMYVPTGD